MIKNQFSISNSIVLQGLLERNRGRKNYQRNKPLIQCFNENIIAKGDFLSLFIEFTILPFQQIYIAQQQDLLLYQYVLNDGSKLEITIKYKRMRKIIVESTLINKMTEKIVWSSQGQLELLNQNLVKIEIQNQHVWEGSSSSYLGLGSKHQTQSFKGLINKLNIIISSDKIVENSMSISSKSPTKIIIPQISHPISLKDFFKLSNKKFSTNKSHFIPKLDDGPKVLVCHDMMNGYIEDINQYSNILSNHHYRFNHFGITDIFIYFSHWNIAIPPKHWIKICKQNNVACLGTFIIEQDIQFYTTDVAQYLIFLAQQYQFDGYLINIQYRVKNMNEFRKWLKYLTQKIHKVLPGSIIIFYDAIISNGELKWQSQLNENNIEFFEICDYFFTDYHWKLGHLQNTYAIAESLGRKADVFIGNDIYGRGTFGGGKFDLYKALRQIQKYGLSIALFAQAYSYEAEGMACREDFQAADEALFFGLNCHKFNLKHEEWNITMNGGNGWKKQGDEAVTSFQLCEREYRFYFNNRGIQLTPDCKIQFSVEVKGTPPKTEDHYKLSMGLYSVNNKLLLQVSNTNNEYQFAPKEFQTKYLELNLKTLQNVKEAAFVRIVQRGKDVEYWGGHYGTRFKSERLNFFIYSEEKDISLTLRKKNYQKFPLHTYFNNGSGDSLYYEGQTQKLHKKGYNYLADYDIPYLNKSKKSSKSYEYNLDFQKVWIGTSSLFLRSNSKVIAHSLLKCCQKVKYLRIRIKIYHEQQIIFHIKIIDRSKQKQQQLIQCQKTVPLKQNWKEYSFIFESPQQEIQIDEIFLRAESKSQKFNFWLGELSIQNQKADPKLNKLENNFNIKIRKSPLKIHPKKAYIDLWVQNLLFTKNLFKYILLFTNNILKATLHNEIDLIEKVKVNSLQEDINIRLIGIYKNGDLQLITQNKINSKILKSDFEWSEI